MSLDKDTDTQIASKPLALTMGEPAGIGGEITLRAWRTITSAKADRTRFFVVDDPARLTGLARRIAPDIPIETIATPADAEAVFPRAMPVLPLALPKAVVPGQPAHENAVAVVDSIKRAVSLVQAGEAAAVVTNPIHKQTLYDSGFGFPGHTEFLADLAGGGTLPVMMLACPGLRVVPVTVHVPLARAAASLSTEAIVHAGKVTAAALRNDFAIARPRLAVAGLNPHAGEGGALGREEIDIIIPAIAELRAAGIDVADPAPADTLFHPGAREGYDAALCMYHDQALIPLKTIDFDHGVNITLGLPFVRTSPDHGTAFGIAGTGQASPASLLAALATADAMASARLPAHRRSVA
ncbi:MAG: 4-hydroxythreonine-4-phosphate dehydrogenase PdxA [Alphaproteobacteria bacterium]